jgi:hypothetical protein
VIRAIEKNQRYSLAAWREKRACERTATRSSLIKIKNLSYIVAVPG